MSEQVDFLQFDFLQHCEVATFTTRAMDRVSVLACGLCGSLVWDVLKHMDQAHGIKPGQPLDETVVAEVAPISAEALARAWWIQEAIDGGSGPGWAGPGWAAQMWDDMGGSEPTAERAHYVLRAREVLHALTGQKGD